MAGEVSITDTFDRLFTTTRTKVFPKVWDVITQNIPLIYWLNLEGQIEYADGGSALEFNIFKELMTAVGAKATQQITPQYATPVTRGRYVWKNLYCAFKQPGNELAKNMGPNAVIDLMSLLVETAQSSLTAALGGSTLGVYSSADESDETIVTGLQNICKPTGNATGTTGNVSRTNSFWQNTVGTTISSFASNGIARWRSTMFNAMRGNEIPNAVVTTLTQYLNYLAALTTTYQVRLPLDAQVANRHLIDAGFPDVGFHGALVIQDANCPSSTAYFLNSKFLKLVVHRERNMYVRPFVLTENEDAISTMVIWMGNLKAVNLARLGVVTGGDTA